MQKASQLQRITQSGVVAVIRADRGDKLVQAANALLEGGVEVMEVTFTVPGALRVLEQVADQLGDRILLGAGTVLDSQTARSAILAGAEFIVSPSVHRDVIEVCNRYGKIVAPGALTPTEVVTAWESGADIVKIFPADYGGPAYLKALRGPLPHIPMLPTGGVNLSTAADFLQAGAAALGVGGALVSQQAIDEDNWSHIRDTANQFVEIVRRTQATECNPKRK